MSYITDERDINHEVLKVREGDVAEVLKTRVITYKTGVDKLVDAVIARNLGANPSVENTTPLSVEQAINPEVTNVQANVDAARQAIRKIHGAN